MEPQDAGQPRQLIAAAERRLPLRIRIAVPPDGLGQQLTRMTAWLDEYCGGGWAMAASGTRGVLNDALAIYFADPALANAFDARWCIGYRAETVDGAFKVRADEPAARVGTRLHRRL